jgi:hypothetical protein
MTGQIVASQAGKADAGKVTGVVLSKESKEPVAGMWLHLLKYEGKGADGKDLISLFILDGQFPRQKSDSAGHFAFTNVPSGQYIIKSGSATSFSTTDGGATALKDERGFVIIIKLESGKGMDLGKILVPKVGS